VNGDQVNERVDERGKNFGVRIMKHSGKHFSDALQLHRAKQTATVAAY